LIESSQSYCTENTKYDSFLAHPVYVKTGHGSLFIGKSSRLFCKCTVTREQPMYSPPSTPWIKNLWQ